MKSIWVIEQGSYSDYRVVGVFSTKESAEKFMGLMDDGYETPSIDEWPLDPMVDEINKGLLPFALSMDIDGNTKYVRKAEGYNMIDGLYVCERAQWHDDAVHGTCWATDEQHAVKIANEFRTGQLISGNLKRASEKKGE